MSEIIEPAPPLTVIVINWELMLYNALHGLPDLNGPSDYGLYAVFGPHTVYGPDSLLYIGKAQGLTFAARHHGSKRTYDFLESVHRGTHIRIGRLVRHKDEKRPIEWPDELWNEHIDVAERILIQSHAPALNKTLVNQFWPTDRKQYLVINQEERGSLLPEVSTFRISYRYYDYERPLRTKKD